MLYEIAIVPKIQQLRSRNAAFQVLDISEQCKCMNFQVSKGKNATKMYAKMILMNACRRDNKVSHQLHIKDTPFYDKLWDAHNPRDARFRTKGQAHETQWFGLEGANFWTQFSK